MGYAPFGQGKINEIYNNDILNNIAKKYNKTPRQIVLRYFTQRDIVVIPKTTDVERMKENINIFDFKLTMDEMEKIKGLNKNTPVVGSSENPNFTMLKKKYNSIDELEKDIIEYIEYYNNRRIKSKLKGMTPVQYRIHSLSVA